MANMVDYNALKAAKAKTDAKFDEMLAKLNASKAKIDQMNQSSWKGASSNVFNEVFEEIKTKINAEREEFNRSIDTKLTNWYNQFSEAEKQQIQAANNM